MNQYIKYEDFPSIPEEILLTPQQIIDAPYFGYKPEFEEMRGERARKTYFRKRVNPELKEWLLKTFVSIGEFTAGYLIINEMIGPHKDLRDLTYNYVIDAGGDDIVTTVWSGNMKGVSEELDHWHSIRTDYKPNQQKIERNFLESLIVEPKKWCSLRSGMLHSVTGNQVRPRIILSVIPLSEVHMTTDPRLSEAVKHAYEEW